MKIKKLSIFLLSIFSLKNHAINIVGYDVTAEDAEKITTVNCGDYFPYDQEHNNKTHLKNYQCKTYLSPKNILRNDSEDLIKAKMFFGHHQATKTKKGTIFINYGGPGINAALYLHHEITRKGIPQAILENFDIIGLDPRGTGASEYAIETAKCLNPSAEEAIQFSEFCKNKRPELIVHIGTNNYVSDIEKLRQLLNEEKIHFIGKSYGGTVGMQYAHKYNDHIGALILDSPSAARIYSRKQNTKITDDLYSSALNQAKKRVNWFIKTAFEFEENQHLQNLTSIANSIFAKEQEADAETKKTGIFYKTNIYLTMKNIEMFFEKGNKYEITQEEFKKSKKPIVLHKLFGIKHKRNWSINNNKQRLSAATEKEMIPKLFFKTDLETNQIIKILSSAKKYYFISPEQNRIKYKIKELTSEAQKSSKYIEKNSKLTYLVKWIDRVKIKIAPFLKNVLTDVNIKNIDALFIMHHIDDSITTNMQNENIKDLPESTKIIITNGHDHCSAFKSFQQHLKDPENQHQAADVYKSIDKYIEYYLMNYGNADGGIHEELKKGEINELTEISYDAQYYRKIIIELNRRIKRIEAMFKFLDKLETGEIKY